MRYAFFIAKRYLFSQKRRSIVHIISLVSLLGVVIGTAALVVVLSVFNGLENLVLGYMNSFKPDLEISVAKGKTFDETTFPLADIQQMEGVETVAREVDDIALATHENRQHIITLIGVDENYIKVSRLDTTLVQGEFRLSQGAFSYIVAGIGVASILNIGIPSFEPVVLYYPRRSTKNLNNPTNAFAKKNISVAGITQIHPEYDSRVVFAPLDMVRELMEYEHELTKVCVKINPNASAEEVQTHIQQRLGNSFVVKNRYQQQESIYKMMKSEKLVIYLILTLILAVAMFNIITTLMMLVAEKRADMRILSQMGADKVFIKRIFFLQGIIITAVGGLVGIAVGVVVCLLQKYLHLVVMNPMAIDELRYYPVDIHLTDILLVAAIVALMGLIASSIRKRI